MGVYHADLNVHNIYLGGLLMNRMGIMERGLLMRRGNTGRVRGSGLGLCLASGRLFGIWLGVMIMRRHFHLRIGRICDFS